MTFAPGTTDTAEIARQRTDTFIMCQEPERQGLQVAGFRAEDALAYDINTAALMLGVCRATVFNEIKRGNLQARKPGRNNGRCRPARCPKRTRWRRCFEGRSRTRMPGKPDRRPTKPGEAMLLALETLEPHQRPLFLQDMEAKARREGDLGYLREIRACKAILASSPTTSPPTSMKPPQDD